MHKAKIMGSNYLIKLLLDGLLNKDPEKIEE